MSKDLEMTVSGRSWLSENGWNLWNSWNARLCENFVHGSTKLTTNGTSVV